MTEKIAFSLEMLVQNPTNHISIYNEETAMIMDIARHNGGQILYATTSIEQKIESILLQYFMGPFNEGNEKRTLFEQGLLRSSAFNFKAKKELLLHVLQQGKSLSKKKINHLQGDLKSIMDWRNTFAHGTLQYHHTHGCTIEYYSGGTKTLSLDNNYWEKVEAVFQQCDSLMEEARRNIS